MTIIDANYILRWFLNDVEAQAITADTLLNTASSEHIVVDRVTIAEVTYVLRSQKYNHAQIFQLFEELYYYPSIKPPSAVDKAALGLFRDTRLDFEDCVLLAHNHVEKYQVGTFDKAIHKPVQ